MSVPPLHIVAADDVLERDDFVTLATALLVAHGPSLALHLRAHGRSGAFLYRIAAVLARVAGDAGALLVVNDRVDVALSAGAGGVQLGARSLPVAATRALVGAGVALGYSAHAAEEAEAAARAGADWVLAGTIYPTASHPGRAGAGPGRVREIAGRVAVPVVAIGGITADRIAEVVAAGARGVAVVGAVWRAPEPRDAAAGLLAALASAFQG
ncbi:MAG TPA: thiamine phosphate synthase [Longimicrobiales bacterium]|nr:thiamine phosphate synthase [Longimicrobiales bacterium]